MQQKLKSKHASSNVMFFWGNYIAERYIHYVIMHKMDLNDSMGLVKYLVSVQGKILVPLLRLNES